MLNFLVLEWNKSNSEVNQKDILRADESLCLAGKLLKLRRLSNPKASGSL